MFQKSGLKDRAERLGMQIAATFEFERVSLPEHECDVLRDVLVAEGACVVIEVGLAYGSSALAIGEAVLSTCGRRAHHVVIGNYPFTAGVGPFHRNNSARE